MQATLLFIEQHSVYFGFMMAALCSLFFSLPKDFNPLSAFALIFHEIANKVNLPTRSNGYKRLASILAFTIIYSPIALIMSQLYLVAFKPLVIDIIVLYALLSWHEKIHIYQQIDKQLQGNHLTKAKLLLSELTLRDTKPLSLMGLNKATIESLVLHLANNWFNVVFWYLASGVYGALFYQLMHICSQQWNRKLPKYEMLGQIPSTLTKILQLPVHILLSFTFSLYDKPIKNLFNKFKQSIHWHHFSSGLLLSSFALSLQIQLGGVRMYESEKVTYANLGVTNPSESLKNISLAIQRISLSAWFWLFCITGYEFLPNMITYFNGGY